MWQQTETADPAVSAFKLLERLATLTTALEPRTHECELALEALRTDREQLNADLLARTGEHKKLTEELERHVAEEARALEEFKASTLDLRGIYVAAGATIAATDRAKRRLGEFEQEVAELDERAREIAEREGQLTQLLGAYREVAAADRLLTRLIAAGLIEKSADELVVTFSWVKTAPTDEAAEALAAAIRPFEGRAPAVLYGLDSRKAIAASSARVRRQIDLLRRGVDAASLLAALFEGGIDQATAFLRERAVSHAERVLAAVNSNLAELGVIVGIASVTMRDSATLAPLVNHTTLDERIAEGHQIRQALTGVVTDYRGFAPGVLYVDSAFSHLRTKLAQQQRLLQPDQPIGTGVDAADCLRTILRVAKQGPVTEAALAEGLTATFGGDKLVGALFAKSVFGLLTSRSWIDEAGQLVVTAEQLSELLTRRAPRLIQLGLIKTERLAQLQAESQTDEPDDEQSDG